MAGYVCVLCLWIGLDWVESCVYVCMCGCVCVCVCVCV